MSEDYFRSIGIDTKKTSDGVTYDVDSIYRLKFNGNEFHVRGSSMNSLISHDYNNIKLLQKRQSTSIKFRIIAL